MKCGNTDRFIGFLSVTEWNEQYVQLPLKMVTTENRINTD